MNDDKHSSDEDEAFWEDEGGDRTITSPFDPSGADFGNVPSPVSDPPPPEPALPQPGTRPVAFAPTPPAPIPVAAPVPVAPPAPISSSSRMAKPELPARAPDDESTRAVSGEAFFSFPDPASLPAAPFDAPRATPRPTPAAPPASGPGHVVVGSDAVGDENTIAVSAPSAASKDIAAALAATLGAGAMPVGAWGAAPEPPAPSHVPKPAPARSPAASTIGGMAGGPLGTPLSVPLSGAGVPGAPFGIRDPASGTMPAVLPAQLPQPSRMPAPSVPHHHPSSGAMPAGFAPPASGSAPSWQVGPGYGAGYPGAGPMGLHAGGPMTPPHAVPAPPRPAPAGGGGPSTLVLVVVGAVCLAIFVVGVVLFLRSNS